MARFQFKKKAASGSPEDGPAGSPPGSASVLAARFGIGRRSGAAMADDGGGRAAGPARRRFNPLSLFRRKAKGAEDAPLSIEGPDGMGPAGREAGGRLKRPGPFALAVAGVVLTLACGLVWLALTAEATVARLQPSPSRVTTVVLPDGMPRFQEAPQAAGAEAVVDPVDLPVTLSASRNDGLLERSAAGYLPKVGPDGLAPWQYYARPFPHEDPRPRIALVITDLGLSPTLAEAAVARLPGAVTFAFIPGVEALQPMIDAARADGHEVLLTVPMEPVGFPANDPGPGTLLVRLSDERNIDRLETTMAAATGYVGLTSTSGSRFLAAEGGLRPILQQVRRRGLVYVDARPVAASMATRLSTSLELPRAVADLIVDRSPSAAGIDAQLAELERLAKANGGAVGFAQAFPVTLERVAAWADGLKDRGVVLAPITAVVNRQADR